MNNAIPAYLLSGFLGSGKTTTLNNLLTQRPQNEQWAILVNEFGELGLDDALLADDDATLIRQVSGGCLCCAQGPAFALALSQLASANPTRLFIEPTGLGHPAQIRTQLEQHPALSFYATFTLVDLTQLLDPEYRHDSLYQQMLAEASYLVLNKVDQVTAEQLQWAQQYLSEKYPGIKKFTVTYGQLPLEYFKMPAPLHNQKTASGAIQQIARWEQKGCGYQSCSWQFSSTTTFAHDQLLELLRHYQVKRVKALIHTDRGWRSLNGLGQQIESRVAKSAPIAKLELIHSQRLDWPDIESKLKMLRLDK